MIRAMSSLLALLLAVSISSRSTQANDFYSPCPNVFTYEPPGAEPNKWYGVIKLTTDTTFYALWLNIVLESKANILGNWIGEVTTEDNLDFKIENTKITISPGEPLTVRFFIQYNEKNDPPRLKAIRFNGREICDIETPQVLESKIPVITAINYEDVRPEVTTSTTVRPTVTTTSRNYNNPQTTVKAQYWYQTEKPQATTKSFFWTQTTPEPTTTLKPQYWTEAKITENTLRTTLKPQYWQETTLKPIFWTQAKSKVNQTTVKPLVWSFVVANQQVTTTVKPTTQRWSQTRTETTPLNTTEKNAVSNVQTTSVNRFQIQNQTTERSPVRPNEKVVNNQNVSSKETRPNSPQTEVKQVGQTQYWHKTPAKNNTVTAVTLPSGTESTSYGWSGSKQKSPDSGLQNEPYSKVSINQADSTQNRGQSTDTPLYVRPEDKIISGNRSDAKNNLDNRPLVITGIGPEIRQPARPVASYQSTTEQKQQEKTGEKTQSWSADGYQSWAEQAKNRLEIQAGINSLSHTANNDNIKDLDESRVPVNKIQLTSELPVPAIYKIDEEYNTPKKDDKEDFYPGGLPIIYIPNNRPLSPTKSVCGKVLLNKDKYTNLKSTSTLEGQYPWQAALYQQQTSVNFRYICGGTLVSKRHVVTAAHCVTKKGSTKVGNKNTLTVYLGKHNLRNSVEGVQVKFVNRILPYPEYDARTFRSDLAILELRDTVTYSDRVQPACLWPEVEVDLKNVIGQTGSVVGWGFEVTGVAREELSVLQMTVVDQETCVNSYREFYGQFTSDKTYCAGFRDSVTACNGDSGGGMVFEKGNSWYLRGIVSLSVARQGEYRCDPNHYVIFTDVAKFLPWIEDIIEHYL